MAQDNGERMIWFVAGAALGAAVALLYAPQAGDRTRRMISRKAKESREVLSESGRDLLDKGRDLYEKGRKVADDAAELFERGRRKVQG
ncbi:MAG TPA: YtxH domain-containing protein [Bryobacteraceae bacterium]|nr:YtxH domain-containing protein [Bryobacteraceae bacterium]